LRTDFRGLYNDALREDLSDFARHFWDRRVAWFGNPRGSFYLHGLSGIVARMLRTYLKVRPRLGAGIEYVVRQLPVWTNYCWALYVQGRDTEGCCPEYLKRDSFAPLKAGLADRIRVHTCAGFHVADIQV
jgi:hypothetical protein